ncbi:MAG TPA: hypothetical protein VGM87_19420 [Roseomonas sp.]|jgi:hypothetical protein
MRRLLLTAGLVLLTTGAAHAMCPPPPGLPIQAWYAQCEPVVQAMYAQGYGRGAPYPNFVQALYAEYAQAGAAHGMPPTANNTCVVGATMCFSGWLRTCQQFFYGTQWITGAQRC